MLYARSCNRGVLGVLGFEQRLFRWARRNKHALEPLATGVVTIPRGVLWKVQTPGSANYAERRVRSIGSQGVMYRNVLSTACFPAPNSQEHRVLYCSCAYRVCRATKAPLSFNPSTLVTPAPIHAIHSKLRLCVVQAKRRLDS